MLLDLLADRLHKVEAGDKEGKEASKIGEVVAKQIANNQLLDRRDL